MNLAENLAREYPQVVPEPFTNDSKERWATDAERTTRAGHADRFWAIALACQKERGAAPKTGTEIGVGVVG